MWKRAPKPTLSENNIKMLSNKMEQSVLAQYNTYIWFVQSINGYGALKAFMK